MKPDPTPADAAFRHAPALRRAVAGVAASLVAGTLLVGCTGGGDKKSATPPPSLKPVATSEQRPTPATEPATTLPIEPPTGDLPPVPSTTRPNDAALTPDGEPVDTTRPTTEPATRPATEPAVEPDAAVAALPTTRPADLLLVDSPTAAGRALATQFETFGEGTLKDAARSPLLGAQGEALLTIAARLAPDDARLARSLVEARLSRGDVAGGLEALEHYRKLKPNDILAQIRFVDLTSDAMQSVDEKVNYLEAVGESDRVADPVRAHAATMTSLLLREALDDAGADAAVQRAVELDPYNPLALQLDFERRLRNNAGRAERAEALARLLRSNPAQPAVLTRLAAEALSAGLAEPANEYDNAAVRVYFGLGLTPPTRALLDTAAVKLITNRPREMRQVLDLAAKNLAPDDQGRSPENFPGDASEAGLLALLQVKATAPAAALKSAAEEASNVLRYNGLLSVHNRLSGAPLPTTVPAEQATPETPLPDVVADAQKLADPQTPPEVRQYADDEAIYLSEQAWIDLYFREQPTDERVLRALELLVPADSATLVRLKGWQLWRQGQAGAAGEKLAAISERDPLARLGLLLMGRSAASRPATTQQGGTDAEPPAVASVPAQMQQLFDENPLGLVGAFLADALRPRGILLQPADDAAAVRQGLAVLETRLLRVLEPEHVGEFYSLDARPKSVRHDLGEPILLNLTLRNSGRDVITVGPDALVKPRMRLDARVGGGAQQQVTAAGEPEWSGATTLRPGDTVEQTVRVDGPQLAAFLASLPQQGLTLTADATTNPLTVQTPQGPGYATAPAGMTVAASRIIDRSGVPLDLGNAANTDGLAARVEQLRSGDAAEQLRATQLVFAQLRWLSRYIDEQVKAGAAAASVQPFRELASQLLDSLQRAAGSSGVPAGDAAPAAAWLKYAAISTTADADRREQFLGQLLTSPAFEARAVGLLALATLGRDLPLTQRLAGPLAEADPDPTVRRFARDLVAYQTQNPPAPPAPPADAPAK